MYFLASTVAAICGVVSIAGGFLGYIQKGSVASMAAGVPAGAILLLAAWFIRGERTWAVLLALVVGLALAGRFLPVFLKDTGNLWPAGAMAVLGLATVLAQIVALVLGRKG